MSKDWKKVRAEADKAIEKGNLAKAAGAFKELALAHPNDPALAHRAGDLFRRTGAKAEGIALLTRAGIGYAEQGALLKAIAVCNVVLELDPTHTRIQALLASLYAQKRGDARPAGEPQLDLGGKPAVESAVLHFADPIPPPPIPEPPPPPAVAPTTPPRPHQATVPPPGAPAAPVTASTPRGPAPVSRGPWSVAPASRRAAALRPTLAHGRPRSTR